MDRKRGIGGTDISAIVGLNPWRTPLDVFLEKTGQKEDQPDNENLWWGREMEPVLAKRYEKETGLRLVIPDPNTLPWQQHDPANSSQVLRPWYIGSPDAIYPRPMLNALIEGGIDFKTSGKPSEWGEPGTDEIPQQYIIQAEWYMGLTGAEWWDIAVLLMGFTRKFAIYRINRDQELIDTLTEAGAKFWQDHVLANVPPALDGSKSATEYVKRLYPRDTGPMLEPTDPEILQEIDLYRQARIDLKNNETYLQSLENRLKAFVGDCGGMQGPWGKITWRRSKDSETVDWKSLANVALQHLSADLQKELMAENTHFKTGSRRWLPRFQED